MATGSFYIRLFIKHALSMQNQFGANTDEKGLLDDLHAIQDLRPASKGQRFANYLIDYIIILGISFVLGVSIGVLMVVSEGSDNADAFGNLYFILFYLASIAYYTGFELGNKGRTIGKMLTGTYAVRQDGAPLTTKDALLRSLSRLVPFEVFSGLGDVPWHDSWTSTTVVDK
jgi:uncharacterized RDD family membrane protein YckC